MNGPDEIIRIAVLTDRRDWPAWQVAALRRLLRMPATELAAVIFVDPEPSLRADSNRQGDGNLPPLPSNPLETLSATVDLLGSAELAAGALTAAELVGLGVNLVWSLDSTPEVRDAGRTLAAAMDARVDSNEAESSPPILGVWVFSIDRGDPTCTRSILRADRMVMTRLHRLGAASGNDPILDEGHFRNEPFSPALTRARVLFGSAGWLARRLTAWRLQGPGALDGPCGAIPDPGAPGALSRTMLPMRYAMSLAGHAWKNCFGEKWTIGICDRPIESFLEPRPLDPAWWPEAEGADYLADPFGIESDRGIVVLAELFDDALDRGRIDALAPAAGLGNGEVDRTETLVRDLFPSSHHQSYPYLVQTSDGLLCVPESHQERRISLYRAQDFPGSWTHVATLVEDFAGIDPTLFQHEGRWWMLCGNHDDECNAKLYGFFADDLAGPWTAHPLNPLKCDPRSSRPAGAPFQAGGALYRPAQDCSVRYGGSVVVNRIDTLSPDAFSESVVARVDPDPSSPYPHGLHTLSSLGDRTLIDAKRKVFRPKLLIEAALHYKRRLGGYRDAEKIES